MATQTTTPEKATTSKPTTATRKPDAKAKVEQPKVTKTPKRAAKAEPADFTANQEVQAYHPRLHPEMGKAIVQEAFKHEHQTYVRVAFVDDGQLVLTHKQNVSAA